ncbi:unnamed protein product [Dovyalis caffra]|uniref:Plastocyanin-like domain-containing protein n=1 Tax=Dovyalis caffra TaxID=77055 RepID=A0AAV1RFH9_9ROSI|nr:unnamed protein product [Dovyalis caffra]
MRRSRPISFSIYQSHALPDTPYLLALKLDISGGFDPTPALENYDHDYNTYDIPKMDVILQNAKTSANDSETHPWHLHGHDFWVLGSGEGQFNEKDVGTFNLDNPIRKNTVPLFPYGSTAFRGFKLIIQEYGFAIAVLRLVSIWAS